MVFALLAQAGPPEQFLDTPSVDWLSMMPVLLLAVPAMVLLHLSSLVGRLFQGFYALYTVAAATASAIFAGVLWNQVSSDGAWSTVAGAYGVDGFSVFLTIVICCAVILATLATDDYLRREGLEGSEPYALMMLSASGGIIMASANDLIVMFLGLEILSIAVYILAAMHARNSGSQEAGMKYFVLGAFSSAFFLYGIAMIYGATGTTNMAEIKQFLAATLVLDNRLLLAGFAFLMVGFGFKVAAVPFHNWTPDVYQGSPSPIVAFMASAVKVAGFAGMLRVFSVTFASSSYDWQPIVTVLSVLSLVAGSILAVVQTDVKRMMAYSSIAHAGFILIGVQVANGFGIEAALFYLAAYTFMAAGTFSVITLVGRSGDLRHDLDDYRGLGRDRPFLALGFTILLLAQLGFPLTSGFFAKFYVISAAIDTEAYWLAIVAMLAAVIGAFIYLRIIVAMFLSDADDHEEVIDLDANDLDANDAEESAKVAERVITRDPVEVPTAAAIGIAIAVATTLIVGFVPDLLADRAVEATPVLALPLP